VTSTEPAGRIRTPASPWLLLCPPGTIEIDLRSAEHETNLPDVIGPVVLKDQRPFSRRRLRLAAARLGLVVEREFVVLPTLVRPMVVIDDTEPAVRHFWSSIATVPPGLVLTAVPASALLGVARHLPWRWTGAAAPGRVVIGRPR
jgi:hypothetical protein